ncbi:MAG TPA: UDP-N-acetylglucosamine 1-carboxyvinyltransferase [Bacilli bacterium]|nr:UDP-N-acetylglucosamine 1-carboxyvinyltransferase [Bacilli bacterium]
MTKIIVQGGNKLTGTVKVSGAKNAVLPILAASLLPSSGVSLLEEVPRLSDVEHMLSLLEVLGVRTEETADGRFRLQAEQLRSPEAPSDLVRKLRASFLVLGPLLARFGKVKVSLPGGCAIGERKIDLHIKGLEALGATVTETPAYVEAIAKHGRLRGADIYLDFPSVGATQNIMMAAVLAEGKTVIENAAKEPEIVDLANYLNKMGAEVRGAGTDLIRIHGVEKLHGAEHTVIPDRIEAGTFLVAAAITRGDVYVEGAISEHLLPVIAKLKEAGLDVTTDVKGVRVTAKGPLKPLDLKTLVYPGFPTDMQAQMMALLTVTPGISYVTETVFENRFMHVNELRRMGANIHVDGRTAVITGVKQLTPARVTSTDLRAGACLILAGLTANGDTEIGGLHHIERGYVDIVDKFRRLGAQISYVDKQEQPVHDRPMNQVSVG